MSGHGDDMQVNGTEGVDQAPQPVVVVQPSVVTESDDRLIAQPPPPTMPIAEVGPSQVQVVLSLSCRCSTCTDMSMLRAWLTRRPVLW